MSFEKTGKKKGTCMFPCVKDVKVKSKVQEKSSFKQSAKPKVSSEANTISQNALTGKKTPLYVINWF